MNGHLDRHLLLSWMYRPLGLYSLHGDHSVPDFLEITYRLFAMPSKSRNFVFHVKLLILRCKQVPSLAYCITIMYSFVSGCCVIPYILRNLSKSPSEHLTWLLNYKQISYINWLSIILDSKVNGHQEFLTSEANDSGIFL